MEYPSAWPSRSQSKWERGFDLKLRLIAYSNPKGSESGSSFTKYNLKSRKPCNNDKE